MQARHINYDDYTLYVEEGRRNGFDVYHWVDGSRSSFALFPNLNRRIDPDDPASQWKHEYTGEGPSPFLIEHWRRVGLRVILRSQARNLWMRLQAGLQHGMRNVPRTALMGHIFSTPANAGIETFYFEQPADSEGAIAQMKQLMIEPQPDPRLSLDAVAGVTDAAPADSGGGGIGGILRFLLYGSLLLGALLLAVRHPFIGRRCLILIPTLLVISVATFVIIQLPPGNFIDARIIELEMEGDEAAIFSPSSASSGCASPTSCSP